MTDSLRKDSKSLRTCILYEVRRGTPVVEAYQNFCEAMGNDALEYREFEFWFTRFSSGNLNFDSDDDKKSQSQVAKIHPFSEFLTNVDEKTYRNEHSISSVFNKFVHEKSAEQAYKIMCKTMGNDKIDYIDFEYWFYQVYNGNVNLDYRRSVDSKSLSFAELPVDIIEKVVGKLNLMSRLRFRKVSRNLRTIVDKQKAEYDKFEIYAGDDYATLIIGDHHIGYYQKQYGCEVRIGCREKKLNGGDFMKMAMADLTVAMKSCKLEMREFRVNFHIDSEDDVFEKWLKFLNSMTKTTNSLFHVEKLMISAWEFGWIFSLLPYVEAGILKDIELNYHANEQNRVGQIVEMDHWKQAKAADIGNLAAWCRPVPIPIERFFHFKRFKTAIESISTDDFIRLADVLSKSKNFEKCDLAARRHDFSIAELQSKLGPVVPYDCWGTMVYRHPIPNSPDILQFRISETFIYIERKH